MKYMKHVLLAVLVALVGFGGVAEAQECVAGAKSPNVRAEGETEVIGEITLRCRGPRTRGATDDLTLGGGAVESLTIAVTLNADITNTRNDNDMVAMADTTATDYNAYKDGNVVLAGFQLDATQTVTGTSILDNEEAAAVANGGLSLTGDVSDDLRTITWKHTDTDDTDDDADFEVDTFLLGSQGAGFELKITGLRADASGVGAGNKITATVKVNGTTVGNADMDAASVMNGLEAVIKASDKGTECADFAGAATVTIKEGFKKVAFMQDDSFMITFTNIPEGVTVMVPEKVGLADDKPGTNANEEAESFILDLVEGTPGDGVGKPEGGKAMVELTATGTGSVRYKIGMTAAIPEGEGGTPAAVPAMPTVGAGNYQEWADVMVDFSWKGGEVVQNADAMVSVSFHPTTGDSIPRFVAEDDDSGALLTIKDCVTSLTFPFVSSASGYDTGIVVSNTKDASGSCTATYSGSEDTMSSPVIEGNSHWIFLVSTHMQDYSGRLMVECDFGGIDGYAQINDTMGNANGYLPRM